MTDEYEVISTEEMDATDAFERATTHLQVNDIEVAKQLLREASSLLRNCNSLDAKRLAKQVQNLLNQYEG